MRKSPRLIAVLCIVLLTACGARKAPVTPTAAVDVQAVIAQAVAATVAALPTSPSVPTATVLPTAAPTATTTALPTATPTAADTPAATKPPATVTPEPIPTDRPTATSVPEVVANRVVNMRAGPWIGYPVVDTTSVGLTYRIMAKSVDESWLELFPTKWVAASVVTISGDLDAVAIEQNIPPTPAATDVQPQAASSQVPADLPGWTEYVDPDRRFHAYLPPGWTAEVGTGNNTGTTLINSNQSGTCCGGYFAIKDGPGEAKSFGGTAPAPFGHVLHCFNLYLPRGQQHIKSMICRVDADIDSDTMINFTVVIGNLELLAGRQPTVEP